MPVAIRRIDDGPVTNRRADLERYVASQVWQRLTPSHPGVLVDATARNMGDYWDVEVFVSPRVAVAEAESVTADLVAGELREGGVRADIEVKSWTGPWG
jgi:hypothetical protein